MECNTHGTIEVHYSASYMRRHNTDQETTMNKVTQHANHSESTDRTEFLQLPRCSMHHNAEHLEKCSSQQERGARMTPQRQMMKFHRFATHFFHVGHLDLVKLLCLHHWIGLGDGIPSCSPVVELAVMLVRVAVH